MAATIAVSCQAAWLSWSWSYPFRPWVRRRNWKWPRPDCLRIDEKWSNMKQHLTVIYGDLHSCLCLQQKRSNCKRTRSLAAAFCQASALPQQEIRQFRVTQSWQKCTSDPVDSRKWCTCVGKWLSKRGCKNHIKWLPESKKQSTYQLPSLKPLPESPGSLKRDCWKLGKATAKRIIEAQVGLNLKP